MKAIFDDGTGMDIEFRPDGILLHGVKAEFDIHALPGQRFHILYKGRSYTAELTGGGGLQNRMTIRLRGREYTVTVKDESQILMESLGFRPQPRATTQSVTAPMPGLIVEVLVGEGQEIREGDPVVLLQAMKMENLIRSPADGIVRAVPVKKGQNVEKGDCLLQF